MLEGIAEERGDTQVIRQDFAGNADDNVIIVLVVEDEEAFIDALTIGLPREGIKIEVARDGAEALAMFDAVAPDLVLLDMMLPRMSGLDVCRELRARSDVPIIMVTASSTT